MPHSSTRAFEPQTTVRTSLLTLALCGLLTAACGGGTVEGVLDDDLADAAGPSDAGNTGRDASASDGGADGRAPDEEIDASGADDAASDAGSQDDGECTQGARRCAELVPETCSAEGQWQAADQACEFVCSAGACAGVCVPGAKQCDGITPQTCNAAGEWESAEACEFVCSAGECAGACVPDSKQCDGATTQTCDADGAWQSAADACEFVCNAGDCVGVCTPGETRCSDATTQETCDALGQWQATGCLQECSPKTNQCACSPGYQGDGQACEAIDFCSAPNGGCSPQATCSQVGITPSCTCNAGLEGDGFSCSNKTSRVNEGFEDITQLAGRGWLMANVSAPIGVMAAGWFQPDPLGNPGLFYAFDGELTHYLAANFNSTAGGNGTISVWAASPLVPLGARTTVSFYTRVMALIAGGMRYPDRVELRACTTPPCSLPQTAAGVDAYNTVVGTVNPNLGNDYPDVWTELRFADITNIPKSGSARFALRYFVTGAGPNGTNSDYIGIDRFTIASSAPAYAVRGIVVGLPGEGPGVELWLNGHETLPVAANGGFAFTSFAFARHLDSGASYSVRVKRQPAGYTCVVEDGHGVIAAADINDVQVTCTAD